MYVLMEWILTLTCVTVCDSLVFPLRARPPQLPASVRVVQRGRGHRGEGRVPDAYQQVLLAQPDPPPGRRSARHQRRLPHSPGGEALLQLQLLPVLSADAGVSGESFGVCDGTWRLFVHILFICVCT